MGESCLPATRTFAGRRITLARIICSPVVITYTVLQQWQIWVQVWVLIHWSIDWLIDCRTPFLCVQGSADVLCNPSGSKLLYRYSTRECTGTVVQGSVQVQYSTVQYMGVPTCRVTSQALNYCTGTVVQGSVLVQFGTRKYTGTVQYSTVHGSADVLCNPSGSKLLYRYSTREWTITVQGSLQVQYKGEFRYSIRECTVQGSVQLQYKVMYNYSTR